MNAALSSELADRFDLEYVGPINPAVSRVARAATLARRIAGAPELFHFFSENRLRRYAAAVTRLSRPRADADFFHGSTPWIAHHPSRPYFAFVDATFRTYVSLYHTRQVLD